MKMIKVLALSAASVAMLGSVAALAGGPEVVTAAPPCAVCVPAFTPFLYIGASAGWAYSDWNSFILSGATDADTNGFTYGGKIGYQFTNHFGIEGGGFVLPDSSVTATVVEPNPANNFTVSGTVDSWFAYGAATLRASLPFNPYLHVIGKVGGVYRALNRSGNLYNNVGDGSYGTVIFGGTVEYDLAAYNLPLALGVDYLYVPGSNNSFFSSNVNNVNANVSTPGINSNAAPAAQVVVGTVSFHFAV